MKHFWGMVFFCFFSFFFFHHSQSLCIWFLDLVIHWMCLAIWTCINSHTHTHTQTLMNPDTAEQLVFLYFQKKKGILLSAYFVWFSYASIHQSILACSNGPGQCFSSSEETFGTVSLVILFLYTWNDLKWMQSFKNQNKLKSLHCTGIHTPVQTSHLLEIHSFEGESCLPLWMSARQRQPTGVPPWICHSYRYTLSACRSSAFIITALTKHSPPSGWYSLKTNLNFSILKLQRKTLVIRPKIIIAFFFVEQLFVHTTHLSSCWFS